MGANFAAKAPPTMRAAAKETIMIFFIVLIY